MAISLSTLSKVLSNGKKVLTSTQRFGQTIKTTTQVLDDKGQIIRERVKHTFPGQAEFRMQTNSYNLADNSVLNIREDFAKIRFLESCPYIQKATSIQLPNGKYNSSGIQKLYNFGSGYYA